ncbi:hypothetical protein BURK1_03272 [Burkholderiales bacterium]|nr:hypothetical protein BURK1_03272 [Burkholderiales bacterium]
MNGVDGTYASPAVRDGFLSALDRRDGVTLTRLARNMTSCGNPLPSTTCTQLGIPVGSSYGFAARLIVVSGGSPWLAPGAKIAGAVDLRSAEDRVAAEVLATDGKGAIPAA